jgi:hypothetical protein
MALWKKNNQAVAHVIAKVAYLITPLDRREMAAMR